MAKGEVVCGLKPLRRLLLPVIVLLSIVRVAPTTRTDRNCPPIVSSEGSPLFPQRTKGGNVTMYRVFHTEGDPPKVNITWLRKPSSLSLSNGRYHINRTLSNGSIRASITVWDLKLFPDVGSYTVTVCSNCTCNTTTFVLQLFKCDPTALPEPVVQYENINITESFSKVLYLYAVFNGSTNTFFYNTDWTHNGKDLCFEGATNKQGSALFTCNRTILGDCLFSANLFITGYTVKNSGNYIVQAIGGGSSSRNSTIHVDILREERTAFCSPGQLTSDFMGNSKFTCKISNYSDYVQVVLVEDNRLEYNESTRDVSFGCEAHTQDRSQATCTVRVSFSSASSGSKRDYQLCAGYNNSTATSQLHCSDRITVIPGNSRCVVLGMVAEVLLIIILLVLLLVLYVRLQSSVGQREDRTETPNEVTPLFKQGGTFHDHMMEARVPGASPEFVECSDHFSRVYSPKTLAAPNTNIQNTGPSGECGSILGQNEWGHAAGVMDPQYHEAHTHSQELSKTPALVANRRNYTTEKFQLPITRLL